MNRITDNRVCGRAGFTRGLLTGLFLVAASASAQQYTQISGVITDASAALVADAMVSVVNEDTGFRRTTLSQSDGAYVVASLQPGTYKITLRKPGFRTMIRFGVKLSEAQPVRADFQLVVGSIQETITVEGSAPLMDTDTASVGTVVTRDQIERLPLNGSAGLLNLLELAPGMVVTPATRGEAGQFTVNGQRPNTHYFTVDGISANSGVSGGGLPAQSTGGALPGLTAFGSMDSLMSLDAVQEVRAQTSSTVPEFGRMPGAQVSLTSRSGSNELHGSLFVGFRNDALDANNWFADWQGDTRAPLRSIDFAGTLGGAIRRNRTFFFLSYDTMRLTQPFVFRQPVPTMAARDSSPAWAQPLINLFPQPNAEALGNGLAEWTSNFSRPSRLQSGAARVDQVITSRLTAFARFSDTPSSTEFGGAPVNFLDVRSRSLTLGLDLRARANLVLDTRASYSDVFSNSDWRPTANNQSPNCLLQSVTNFFATPGVCNYLVRLTIAGVGDVVSGSEGLRSQSQFHLNHTTSWNLGSHTLRFGADYRRLQPIRRDATGGLSLLADQVSDLSNSSNLWVGKSPQLNAIGEVQEISLFAQDTWRMNSRLTASYGVRWEISPAPATSGLPEYTDPQTGAPILQQPLTWRSTYANIAPRAGIAWRLTASGRTVLRAGGGFYYDSSLSLATDLVNSGPLNVTEFTSVRYGFVNSYLNYGFAQNLRLPLVRQWNVSLEHAFSNSDTVSVGYVGASGRGLVRREISGGVNQRLWLALATNDGSSDYNSLEVQYRRRLSRGLQATASYAWAHSMDNSSSDSGLFWTADGAGYGDRASSDFDIRHVLTVGFTYQVPSAPHSRLLRGWSLDGMMRARSGFPINVQDAEQFTGVNFDNVFRPNLVYGQAVWITDPSAPGGRRINAAAFQAAPYAVQGNLGRNALTGFRMAQLDLALRREFFVNERRSLQFRVEAFNATNHPNFADPVRFLSSTLFGQSSSMLNLMLGTGSPGSGLAPIFQSGGARSLRVVLRFTF